MHRAYQPITPANNKLLKKRWDMTRYDMHRKKVQSANAVLDNHPPKTYLHLHLKLKKMQIEEERLATVERDNRILLEKMSYIMRTKGRVDNRNDYEHKSLNKTKRQRELLRVTHENQAILKRITSKEPHLNHLNWEEDWATNQQYMDNIAKYPKDWYKLIVRKTRPRKKDATSDEQTDTEEATKHMESLPNDRRRSKNSCSSSEGRKSRVGSKKKERGGF
ncbi:sperm axonemal maintenance protein CFAP97D1-like isoform X1 [Hydractinia symbiolongicarpus]|uniref:sperm axonemal maintenance protein CFAP97D1-like isoform X1 n=1 Tax=Hydractinia symbiolongicarpus TaxID=13093 RepID=UPI00254B905D|nr:sperm axonemal maintenance protein CFAP97D1-like isoform X1 [Hydractinia symbiolongicarpus]